MSKLKKHVINTSHIVFEFNAVCPVCSSCKEPSSGGKLWMSLYGIASDGFPRCPDKQCNHKLEFSDYCTVHLQKDGSDFKDLASLKRLGFYK